MGRRPTTRSTDELLRSLLVLSRAVEEVLEPPGAGRLALGGEVTSNKLRALCFLDQQGAQAATRVAGFLKVTPGAITQLADALEGASLVERLRTGEDRRVVSLSLTAKGRRFVRSVRQEQRHILQNAHRGMSSTHVNRWAVTLDEISVALATARRAFADLCLQCGAYADGTCVLDGGTAACKFQAKPQARTKQQERRRPEKLPRRKTKTRVGSGGGSRTNR